MLSLLDFVSGDVKLTRITACGNFQSICHMLLPFLDP